MAIDTNNNGIGTLARVAWTPLEGTGLTTSQRAGVETDIATAAAMARALLEAANSAFNAGLGEFSLNDLSGPTGLGGGAYLGRTNLRVATTAAGDDTAGDWASFIGRAMGKAFAAGQALGLTEWRRLAADLQRYAALQTSRRDPVTGVAGGITHANGQWYANGQALSLLDLFTAARVNQAANYDNVLDGLVGEIEANSRRITAAREWASMIRRHLPTATGEVAGLPADRRTEFMAKWGFDPYTTFHKTQPVSTNVWAPTYDIWLTDVKTYIDDKDSDSRKVQEVVKQKSNRRSEVLEAMVTFATGQSKTGNAMANSLG